jgi:hypothetical protein
MGQLYAGLFVFITPYPDSAAYGAADTSFANDFNVAVRAFFWRVVLRLGVNGQTVTITDDLA